MKNSKLLIVIITVVITLIVLVVANLSYGYIQAHKYDSDQLPNEESVCGEGGGCSLSDEVTYGFEVGDTIPNLTLTDFNGNEVMLYDLLEGKDKFILNLSVNWCSDCQRQNDKLQEYYTQLPENVGVAVVYVDFSKGDDPNKQASEELARQKIETEGYTFPTYYDYDQELLNEIEPTAVPVNFVIDGSGEIKAHTQEIDMDILLQDNLETYNPIITQQ
jgi:peroxiredoxin